MKFYADQFVCLVGLLVLLPGCARVEGLQAVQETETKLTTNQELMTATNQLKARSYRLVIKKAERKLHLYGDGKMLKTYVIALGFNPTGTKQKQGDGATPEGDYYITHKNPRSKYHLSLGVSYPNVTDAASGLHRQLITQAQHDEIVAAIKAQAKPPQNTKLGGDIFIHGGGSSSDWTLGCVAVTNDDIEELFALLPVKTPVKIEP